MFEYSVETHYTIDEAVNRIEESLKDEKFGVLWEFDINEKLQEKGLDFQREFKVLEVCNPQEAYRVLSKNNLAGYFLPCKIVVYEENGQTIIGMPRPTSLIHLLHDENLQMLAKDIEERLIICIDKAK
ncbi:hypothetical protein J6TS2_40000 [Heyndrickxia sporothermodurans]|nr:hypothetical protein J6TS2_40000 [Heyndrickxia sporothermodurans]